MFLTQPSCPLHEHRVGRRKRVSVEAYIVFHSCPCMASFANAPLIDHSLRRPDARSAFEGYIRRFAEKRHIRLGFEMDPKVLSTDTFLDGIDAKLARAPLKVVVVALRAMRAGVLNLQSYDDALNPSTPEIEEALSRI